jgi:hypothetical protein
LPDNIGRQIVDMGQMYGPKGEGRDLAINSNPRANMVNNTVGKPDFQLHFTEEGEVFDAEAGFKPATGLKQIALEEGDVVIGGSDGLWKNIPNRNLAYEWTKGAKTAQEKVAILDAKIRERMKVVDEADRKFGNHELSDSERMPFQMDGKDLFIDNAGNVYDQAKDGTLVDHYEADNVSIFVYVHKLGGGETAKVEPKQPAGDSPTGDPKTPSDTSLSDPDKTTMWVRPESLKDTVVVEDPKNAARDPDEEVTVVRPMPKDTGNPQ